MESLEPRALLSAGSLDTAFGSGGTVAVQFPAGRSITIVRDSLVQPDGKIVIAGEAADPDVPGGSDFAIARLNPDGTPDLTFNGTGLFAFPSPGNVDVATGVALQSDGRIVVSATFGETRADQVNYGLFAVGRFNTDGTVDATFGDDGALVVNFNTVESPVQVGNASDVLVGPDDRITVVGYARPDPLATDVQVAIARLNADSTMDASFGVDGKVLTSVLDDAELALAAAFDSAANILVTGTSVSAGDTSARFFTARFLPTGDVDTSFGEGGAVATDFSDPADAGTLAAAQSIAVQPDGQILVAGLVGRADADGNVKSLRVALARYAEDGTPDLGFGDLGRNETDLGAFTSINKLLVDEDGRIISSGLSAPTLDALEASQFDPFVAQFTADGELDTTFGDGGSVVIDVTGLAAPGGQSLTTRLGVPRAAASMLGLAPAALDDDSQSQQAIKAFQQQSAIVVALGTKLLVVTTAGDTLTAAQLIGNGADLVAAPVTGIKAASVLGGAKGALAVQVSNAGNEPLAGAVTVRVLLSADAVADAGDAVATSSSSTVKLKTGRARTLKVKFVYPATLPDGPYFVLAVADAGAADVSASNNTGASAAPVTVAKPFVNLGGTVGTPPPLTVGRRAKLALNLRNAGNVPAQGAARVTLYASTDAALDAADAVLAGPLPLRLGLKANSAKGSKVSVPVPADLAPGTYLLIAVIDASALPESDVSDNTLVTAVPATVS